MPPPAEGIASRLVLGPALRTQPDRRLVALVRQGYETAFEEIVRRYAKPLGRYAAAIVGPRSEDVTQDAFSKALLALRRSDAEIELRPWLFRIVRNTALNDLRDSPPSSEAPAAPAAGGADPAEALERREELADLMRRLQALPAQQRAAIVMRELEGLGHDEIAAALGLSGGAARQAIYRARRALRDGVGMLLPLPLLRALIDHAGEATAAGAAGGAIATAGATAGGAGAGSALKVGAVAAVLAGSIGAGVAIEESRDRHPVEAEASAGRPSTVPSSAALRPASTAAPGEPDLRSGSDGAGDGDEGHADRSDRRVENEEGGEDRGGGESNDGQGIADDDLRDRPGAQRGPPFPVPHSGERGRRGHAGTHGGGDRGRGGELRPIREDDRLGLGRSTDRGASTRGDSRPSNGDGGDSGGDGSHDGHGSRHDGRDESSPPQSPPPPPPAPVVPPAEAESDTSEGTQERTDARDNSRGQGSQGDDRPDGSA